MEKKEFNDFKGKEDVDFMSLNDPEGAYTGNSLFDEEPEQDADDL